MATLDTLATQQRRHPLKAPCLHLSQYQWHRLQSVVPNTLRSSQTKACATSQIGTSIVKKLKERALSLPGKLPAPSILREFCFEIWERESAPADYCLIRRLSMDVSCPSLPPKILVADEVRPNETTHRFMAAHGCHFILCSRYVLLFIIEFFFLAVRDTMIARTVLYKVSIAIVSRLFYEKRSQQVRYS